VILDKIGSTILLSLFLLIFPAIALFILLEDGFPIFFTQIRVGKDFKFFRVYKLRTMRKGAETDPHSTVFAGADNPYLLRIGKLLRKYGIDELPQLFNVLYGHMSLIGPRPIPPYEYKLYDMRGYGDLAKLRVLVKPGITGWAQIWGRNELPWEERIKYDVWYVENRSIILDLFILFKTIPVVLKGRGVFRRKQVDLLDFLKNIQNEKQ
jgi:lipopolysaccharide/colanic/teichoic acid biosynthesis glycosyltransferase